ncbi:MAG: hypothetical protein KDA32_01995 [Phycisphaerales bacterium]|nr:hypothetical protein [Phycisphaerales bacterium]
MGRFGGCFVNGAGWDAGRFRDNVRERSNTARREYAGTPMMSNGSSLLLACLFTGGVASAAPIFQPANLDEAQVIAKRLDQPILALITARWSQAGARVDSALRHSSIRTFLEDHVVTVRLEISASDKTAERLRIQSVPTLLLLDADGAERDLLMPTALPERLRADLQAALAGRDAEARARALIAELGPGNPTGHEHLAIALERRGMQDEALEAYLKCVDPGLRNVAYAAARRDILATALARMAETFPAAAEAVDRRRAEWRDKLTAGRDDVDIARNVAAFNLAFGDEADTLALYDALPPASKPRRVLHDRVINQLVDARRYGDVAADGQLIFALRDTIFQATRGDGGACCSLHAPRGPGSGLTIVERGARLAETAAALQRADEAKRIIMETLKFEDTPENRATIRARLKRAGVDEGPLIEILDK